MLPLGSRAASLSFAAVLASLLLASGSLPTELLSELRWSRDVPFLQQPHRYLTAHFAHLDFFHAAWNAGGFLLVWIVLHDYLTAGRWLAVFLIAVLAIDIGLMEWSRFDWYVGASGWIHALAAAGISTRALQGERLAIALGVLGVAKLAAEVCNPQLASLGHGAVVATLVHLIGVAAGASCALAFALRDRVTREATGARQ